MTGAVKTDIDNPKETTAKGGGVGDSMGIMLGEKETRLQDREWGMKCIENGSGRKDHKGIRLLRRTIWRPIIAAASSIDNPHLKNGSCKITLFLTHGIVFSLDRCLW